MTSANFSDFLTPSPPCHCHKSADVVPFVFGDPPPSADVISGSPLNENQFSGKTYFYTIASSAAVKSYSSTVSLREGNFAVAGRLGNFSLKDLTSHGALYKDRFLSRGENVLTFDLFKYGGPPDDKLARPYDAMLRHAIQCCRDISQQWSLWHLGTALGFNF